MFAIYSLVHCVSAYEPGASGLPYSCPSFCVRSRCYWRANCQCVDSNPKKKKLLQNNIQGHLSYGKDLLESNFPLHWEMRMWDSVRTRIFLRRRKRWNFGSSFNRLQLNTLEHERHYFLSVLTMAKSNFEIVLSGIDTEISRILRIQRQLSLDPISGTFYTSSSTPNKKGPDAINNTGISWNANSWNNGEDSSDNDKQKRMKLVSQPRISPPISSDWRNPHEDSRTMIRPVITRNLVL